MLRCLTSEFPCMVGTFKLYTEKPCLGIERDREEEGGRGGGGYIGT